MKHFVRLYLGGLFLLALVLVSCRDNQPAPAEPVAAGTPLLKTIPGLQNKTGSVSVFATGLDFPRGLRFGPDRHLYVAEAGRGGTMSTNGQSVQVVPPIGPYTGGYTARISRISPSGKVSTVVDGLPSGINAVGDVLGVADVDFVGHTLYALLAGGGSSHGFMKVPASVIRVSQNGNWSVVANLSIFQQHHAVANPFLGDFEPDGSWYSMVNVKDDLFAVEPNHGELDKIEPWSGKIKRVVDISASQGHIVPTAMAYHNGNFYVGNLDEFPLVPGACKILKISQNGTLEVWGTGFTMILGLAFDDGGRLYVLESSTAAGFPTPGTGRVVRVHRKGPNETIADGLFLPTGMTYGPDNKLYVSNKGYGPPSLLGAGEILRIDIPDVKDNHQGNND